MVDMVVIDITPYLGLHGTLHISYYCIDHYQVRIDHRRYQPNQNHWRYLLRVDQQDENDYALIASSKYCAASFVKSSDARGRSSLVSTSGCHRCIAFPSKMSFRATTLKLSASSMC